MQKLKILLKRNTRGTFMARESVKHVLGSKLGHPSRHFSNLPYHITESESSTAPEIHPGE